MATRGLLYALASLLSVTLAVQAQAQTMYSEGTLLILVASRDGLVVASDSRQTVDDKTYCDGANKLLEPERPDRFIVAVTGRRGFYPWSIAVTNDVCSYVRSTPREFDLGEVAKKYVEENAAEIDLSAFDATKLAQHCRDELFKYFLSHPYRLPAASGDIFSSAVVLASYEPSTARAAIRTIHLAVTSDGKSFKIDDGLTHRFGLDDAAEPIVIGEGDYLREQVLPTIKDQPLSVSTRDQIGDFPKVNFSKVRDTTLGQAVAMATDLIEAAAMMTAIVPAKSGIGGPVDVRLLGVAPRPVRLR